MSGVRKQQIKDAILQLEDMGFTDRQKSLDVLKKTKGVTVIVKA